MLQQRVRVLACRTEVLHNGAGVDAILHRIRNPPRPGGAVKEEFIIAMIYYILGGDERFRDDRIRYKGVERNGTGGKFFSC